ncbi:MAG: hypothetical protein MUE54_05505 [Anaerolineae bacterium]|jgi:hypothetical protein|nr:hypothetical protein [Anaerolineae bacterium]
MNIWFLIAGILCLMLLPIHIWGGEYVFNRMPAETFPKIPNGDGKIAKQEIRFAWHGVSVTFLVSAGILLFFAFNPNLSGIELTAFCIALYFIGFAVVIALLPAFTLRTYKTLLISPQWVACLLVGLVILGGVA